MRPCLQQPRAVLRSSRNPNKPSKSSPRNSDGLHKPDSNCGTSHFDDVDDLVFDVLPSLRPKDMCSFETLVTLESNLPCYGRECILSTLRVIEVVQGKSVRDIVMNVGCIDVTYFLTAHIDRCILRVFTCSLCSPSILQRRGQSICRVRPINQSYLTISSPSQSCDLFVDLGMTSTCAPINSSPAPARHAVVLISTVGLFLNNLIGLMC